MCRNEFLLLWGGIKTELLFDFVDSNNMFGGRERRDGWCGKNSKKCKLFMSLFPSIFMHINN